ncbi:MAG: pyridoxal phosphate-dependent aminotransferase [Clostridia bacterium]|nr:pyridoxal phosphate-dependent aminotransferase [Clostridia bacterium]
MDLSAKNKAISPSPTLSIDAKFKAMKAAGEDVVGFGTGEPDFDTPQYIKDAAIKAISDGFTKYTPASGTLELRNAIAEKLKKDNGLEYEAKNIVVSNGAKHSLVNAFSAILNPGDEVIIPAPFWVSYPEMVKMADGTPKYLYTKEENGFKFSASELENAINDKTKALVLNSPSNPTGMVYNKKELEEIADVCVRHNIFVISDEVYEKLIYEGKHISIASFNDKIKDLTITINGVSKSYAMTGWRIGYAAANDEVAKIMSNIQSHAASNPNSIAQAATVAALKGPQDEVEEMRKVFKERRDYMVERINSIEGVSCIKPSGAFYVMMNIEKLIGKTIAGVEITGSDAFAEAFLAKQKVALVPGKGFGDDKYLRWSYATSMDNIKEGLSRLEKFLNE